MPSSKTTEVSQTFKNSIKAWVDLSNQRAAVLKDMAVINNRLKELKAYITMYMKTNGLDGCNVQGNKVILSVGKTREPLTKENLTRLITEFRNGDAADSTAMADHILNNRKSKESYGLRKMSIPGYALSMQDESMGGAGAGGAKALRDTATSVPVEEEDVGDNESVLGDDDL